MRIKEGFILKNIAGSWVVLPTAAATLDFTGMLTLNESGRFLWNQLSQGASCESLAKSLTEEYYIDYETALSDVNDFVLTLKNAGCVEDEPHT